MILSYKDKRTELFASGVFGTAFEGFERQAARRLSVLNAAPSLDTLGTLPGNRLEALGGERKGQYSIRINRQWRICVTWSDGPGATDVEIVDYHQWQGEPELNLQAQFDLAAADRRVGAVVRTLPTADRSA